MKKFLNFVIAFLVIIASIFTYDIIGETYYEFYLTWAIVLWVDAVALMVLRGRIARQPLGQAVVAFIVLQLAMFVLVDTYWVIRLACTIKELDSFLIRQINFCVVLWGVFIFNLYEWKRLGRKLS